MRHDSRNPATRRSIPEGWWRWVLVLLAAPQVLWAQAPAPARGAVASKLAPGLHRAAAQPQVQTVRVRVPNPAAFRQWLRQHLPAAHVLPSGASAHTLTVAGLDAAALAQLAASPLVDFVDVADRPARQERRLSNSDLSVNAVSVVHRRFPELTGEGLTVSVKELPFDPNDIDFKGRVVSAAAFPGPPSDHATTMTTLIGGAGNSDPLGRGVARAVRLATSSFTRLLPDDGPQLALAGVSVQNHSYGVAIENYYGLEALEYDQQCQQYPTLLHVFSSGNVGTQASPSGPYQGIPGFANLTGQFKMSKNTLSVGATDPSSQVAARSSRGPAHDGRVKPELVAYGEGGTSESAALVSGMGLLLQQAYRDQRGALPPAALVKAVLLNSADDLGRPEVDYVSGFGQADAPGAVATVREGRFFAGSAAQNAVQVFGLTVPPGQQLLKATLAWSDPTAAANAARALVNDLDLELVAVGTGQRWLPWALSAFPHPDSLTKPARRRADHLNNVEQITLTLPAPGTYELRVRGFGVSQGPQAFSVAYETSPPTLTWTHPNQLHNLRPGSTAQLRWQWTGPVTTTGRLEYRAVGRPQWRPIETTAALSQNRFAWSVPDTTTLAQLRVVVGSSLFVSDTFGIVRAPAVQVGYTCPNETLLQWARVPGATGYQVYQLGSRYLTPFVQTADTTLVLSRPQMAQTQHYAVAPILSGKPVQPGITIDFTTQGTACYFRSFLVRELVSDVVRFDVELGSVFRLQSAALERLGPGGYQAVQTVAPLRQTSFSFTDLPPVAGRHLYRVRLTTVAGLPYFSEPAEAFFLPRHAVQAYPNPVPPGEVLKLVASSSTPVAVQLYDLLGRLQREESVDGVINNLNTSGLKPGMYLLRVRLLGQPAQVIRVVIE